MQSEERSSADDDLRALGRAPPRSRTQAALLAGSLAVWALAGPPVFLALLCVYLALWAVFAGALARGASWPRVMLGRRAALTVAVAVASAAAIGLAEKVPEVLETEGLVGLLGPIGDRARVQAVPAIAPALVCTDRPQVFWIHAPGARDVTLTFPGARALPALDAGHGLFRVDYDPAKDGTPPDGPIDAAVSVDGGRVPRALMAVRPLSHPRGISSSAEAGIAAAVSEETDELYLLARGGRVVTRPTGDGPTDAIVLPGRRAVAVTHRYGAELSLYDWTSGELLSRRGARPFAVHAAVSLDGSRLAVAIAGSETGLELYDLAADEALGFVPLPFAPDLVAFGPTASTLVVSSRRTRALHVYTRRANDLDWGEAHPPFVLGRPVLALAPSPDHRRIVASVPDYRPEGGPGPNHFVEDQLLVVDVEGWRIARRLATAEREDDEVVGGASPAGLVFRADGRLLATFRGTDELAVLDLSRGVVDRAGLVRAPAQTAQTTRPALLRPHGIGDLGEGVVVVSSPADGAFLFTRVAPAEGDGERGPGEVVAVSPSDADLDPRARLRRRGERAYLEATRSGVSCESCHPDADSDLSLHDIGQVAPRPTLTTRGIARTAPYLRGASYAAIGGLEHFAGTILGGWAHAEPDRVAALEAFVEALPPLEGQARLARLVDATRLRAGVDAFVRARCDLCHAFPAFTGLGQYPVQFLFPERRELELLDTPSLIAAAKSPPYLHDGRAKTLEAVLDDAWESGRHGNVWVLDADERAALLDLLEAL